MTGARRWALVFAVAVVAVTLAIVVVVTLGGPVRRTETGVVVAVQATSLQSIQGFSIRTSDGRTVDFRVGKLEYVPTFPPGHLTEHRATLRPVLVTYVDEAGSRVAIRIEDAP